MVQSNLFSFLFFDLQTTSFVMFTFFFGCDRCLINLNPKKLNNISKFLFSFLLLLSFVIAMQCEINSFCAISLLCLICFVQCKFCPTMDVCSIFVVLHLSIEDGKRCTIPKYSNNTTEMNKCCKWNLLLPYGTFLI